MEILFFASNESVTKLVIFFSKIGCIVSFRHYQIFGFYFPPEIINWGCDDWLTEIYEKHNMVYRLPQKFLNLGGKPRYKIDRNYEYNYKKCLKDYGNRIEEYKKFSGELINYF